MKNLILYLLPIVLLINACSNSETASNETQIEPLTSSALAQNPAIQTGMTTKRRLGQDIACNGKIHIPPSDNVSIHSMTEGYVAEINYLPGEYVAKGATLIRIHNPKLIELERKYLETKADLELAEKEFTRKAALRTENATSDRLYDEAVSLKRRLQATYKGYQKQLQVLGVNTTALEAGSSFQQQVRIRADKSGYISKVAVNKGQYITAQTLLMQLASDDHLHIELKVYDENADKVRVGQSVLFTAGRSGEEFQAEVVHINPVLDEKDASLQVHCHFDKNPKLKAGMFVTARIRISVDEMNCLPASAVFKEGNEYFAYKVAGQKVVKTALTGTAITKNWISSKEINTYEGQWVTEGAYYVE